MKGIIGAITGDVIGSTREFYPIKTKDFELFTPYSRVTDDSILTLAVANWLCEDKNSQDVLIKNLQYFGNRYPDAGYGSSFGGWLVQESPKPYDSWANGSAMRVSPCAWVADILKVLKVPFQLQMQFILQGQAQVRMKLEIILKRNMLMI